MDIFVKKMLFYQVGTLVFDCHSISFIFFGTSQQQPTMVIILDIIRADYGQGAAKLILTVHATGLSFTILH